MHKKNLEKFFITVVIIPPPELLKIGIQPDQHYCVVVESELLPTMQTLLDAPVLDIIRDGGCVNFLVQRNDTQPEALN